jgi:membrane protein YqaA with SNARE-associated domain
MDAVATLPGLFLSSFLSATLLPGGSELILFALLARDPSLLWPALLGATVANTLGGLTSYLIGGWLRRAAQPARETGWLRRFGAPLLLLSWLPVIGDALCVGAGWLRVHVGAAALCIGLGKFARYAVVAAAALA